MRILAIETATAVGSVALVGEDRVVASRYFDTGVQHSQLLFVETETLLASADFKVRELDAVAVSIGPGSFTGLRIGLSAAKGLCMSTHSSLVTVPTLAALAARLPFAKAPVCAMIDARKEQVYAAVFDTSSGTPVESVPVRAIAVATVLEERRHLDTVYVGDAVDAYGGLFTGPSVFKAPFHCLRPDAAAIGWLGLAKMRAGETADIASAEPEYVRKTYVDVEK